MTSKHNVLDIATTLNIEAERKHAAQSDKAARVKIERGHAWLIRLLPFPQGPARETFARLAQHWVGGRAVMCKAKTSPNFGGDPEYDCPICSTAAACKNEARDDDERDEFYRIEARESYRCYCLVWAKENDRGVKEEMEGDEIYNPYEFNIAKSSFVELAAKIDRSMSRKGSPPTGLLDLESGNDLWAIRDKKNSLTFDLAESGPVFTLDDNFDAKLQRVWKQMRQPLTKYLDDDRLAALADMVAEKAFEKAAKSLSERRDDGGRRSDSSRSSSPRGRSHEAEDESTARGSGRLSDGNEDTRSARSSARSSGYTRAQAAIGNDDDQVPGAEVPARGRRTASSAEPEDAGGAAVEPGDKAEEAPAVSSRRGGSSAQPGKVSVPPAVAASRRPPPPPTPSKADSARVEDEGPGEGEPAPEETDQVQPAKAETAPVTQASRGAPARGALHGVLRNNIAKLASSGR